MDICYVCGNILSDDKICSVCGFDASADTENYPALQLAPGKTSIAEQQNRRIQTIIKSVTEYQRDSQEKLIRSLFEEAFKKFADDEKQQIKDTVEAAVKEQGEKLLQQLKDAQPAVSYSAEDQNIDPDKPSSAKASRNTPPAQTKQPDKNADQPAPIPSIRVGNTIKLGNYGGILEWEVLEIKDGNALVICTELIDTKKFNEAASATSWQKCMLRQWLNNTFYQHVFSAEEKNSILCKTVPAHHNPQRPWVDPGADSKDYVFLLSYVEVEKYPQIKKVERENTARAGYEQKWWLRTPGWNTSLACYVNELGEVVVWEAAANVTKQYGVRPAMWLKLTK